jgi:uncharacterized protein
MGDTDMARINRHVAENMNSFCTACGYCKDCPQDIPVATYMQVYNEKAFLGKTDEQMKKTVASHRSWGLLNGRPAEADDCSRCAGCEDACTQHLNIIDRLDEIAAWEKEIVSEENAWRPRLRRCLGRLKRAAIDRVLRF